LAATFTYKARDGRGGPVNGRVEAETAAAAADLLRARGYFVVKLEETAPVNTGLNREIKLFQPKVKAKDLAIFCRQFATMLGAGMTIIASLRVLSQQAENQRLRAALTEIIASLEQGHSLFDAVKEHQQVFPAIFINMAEAGEVGGVLEEIMERLAEHFERESDTEEKVRSAMTYPLVVLGIAVVAVVFLLAFVLPVFADMLTGLGAELPLPTRIVLGVSAFFQAYWYLLLVFAAALAGALRYYLATGPGSLWWDGVKLKAPVFGDLNRKMAVSRFSRTLGTLVRGGVPILRALDVTKNTAGNQVIARAVERARNNIREGEAMAPPLAATGVFPVMVTEMIAVGEETGALDTLLEKISFFYDREVEATTARLSSLIEPFMIVGLGLVVGFIVISIMLPIFSMSTMI